MDASVKAMALKLYREKGIKTSCEHCYIVTDPRCPDFPHICELEESLKNPDQRKWAEDNIPKCIEMRKAWVERNKPFIRKSIFMGVREKGAYFFVIVGFFLDQISTRMVLTQPLAYEANLYVSRLMASGMWLLNDLFFVAVAIGIPFCFIRITLFKNRHYILLFPYIFGILKILASFWNFYILFKILLYLT